MGVTLVRHTGTRLNHHSIDGSVHNLLVFIHIDDFHGIHLARVTPRHPKLVQIVSEGGIVLGKVVHDAAVRYVEGALVDGAPPPTCLDVHDGGIEDNTFHLEFCDVDFAVDEAAVARGSLRSAAAAASLSAVGGIFWFFEFAGDDEEWTVSSLFVNAGTCTRELNYCFFVF